MFVINESEWVVDVFCFMGLFIVNFSISVSNILGKLMVIIIVC